MDGMKPSLPPGSRRAASGRLLLAGCVLALFGALLPSGCSLFVMGGKMLMGDPKVTSQFKKATLVDLAKSKERVLILCSGTDFIRANYPSVEFDILDSVTRQVK